MEVPPLHRFGVLRAPRSKRRCIHALVTGGDRRETGGRARQQLLGAMDIAAQEVDVPRSHLREAFEELRIFGVLGLLPGRLPPLVGREVAPLIESETREPVVLNQRQGIEVGELELIRCPPRQRAAQKISRTSRFVPLLRGFADLAGGFFSHGVMVAPSGDDIAASPVTELRSMDPVQFTDQPALHEPVVVLACAGWNDGGDAASTAALHLGRLWHTTTFATLDPEEFFDFQSTRPIVQLVDGRTRSITWPTLTFAAGRAGERDVVLITGPEPNLRWRTFARAIVTTSLELGATRLITLGAFMADVAHRQPVPIVGSASDATESERLGLHPSNYEGPTGIIGVTHDMAARAELATVSFWAAVPHYLGGGENPKAALALIDQLAAYLDIEVQADRLARAAEIWEETVNDELRENASLKAYVERLERGERGGLGGEEDDEFASPRREDENGDGRGELPNAQTSGEEIAAEIERFLQSGEPGAL